ncbi:hypothetical protein EVA_16372 [gut metagenome]|uniref:Uncharacterized protein n=1 Tax=gut metagenome TaxID=749906 RepID=J9FKV0_9ZZZZ
MHSSSRSARRSANTTQLTRISLYPEFLLQLFISFILFPL